MCSQQLPLAMADPSQQLLVHRLCLLLAAIAVRSGGQGATQFVHGALALFQEQQVCLLSSRRQQKSACLR